MSLRLTTTRAAIASAVLVAFALPAPRAAGQQPPASTGIAGKSLFSTYCASCHGSGAKGDGPFAKSLRKRPPDLTGLALANGGTFPAERVAKMIDGRDAGAAHGNSDMPVWGDAFSRTKEDSDPESVQRRIQSLVRFLETIQQRPVPE
jgi:mono/diheme cytochrome c family protein